MVEFWQQSLRQWINTSSKMVQRLSLTQRAKSYNTHPKYREYAKYAPLCATDYYLYGWWMIGNDFTNTTDFYGAYPHGYLDRMRAVFPDFTDDETLHLFSGSLDESVHGFRVDLLTDNRHPQLITDAHNLSFRDGMWGIIYADPPYSKLDAERYDTKMIVRRVVVKEAIRVLEPTGFLVWLDEVYPQFNSTICKLVGHISITRSTNHRERSAFIFQKHFRPLIRQKPKKPRSKSQGLNNFI